MTVHSNYHYSKFCHFIECRYKEGRPSYTTVHEQTQIKLHFSDMVLASKPTLISENVYRRATSCVKSYGAVMKRLPVLHNSIA